jgi:hypothetical protein
MPAPLPFPDLPFLSGGAGSPGIEEIVGDLKPWCLAVDEDVEPRANAGVVVERRQRDAVFGYGRRVVLPPRFDFLVSRARETKKLNRGGCHFVKSEDSL